MKTIELTITQEDLEKAQKEKAAGQSMNCCCLIFQASKRAGIKPKSCGLLNVLAEGGNYLVYDCQAKNIAKAYDDEWPKFVGTTFTLTGKL
jgi:hypothetical protein